MNVVEIDAASNNGVENIREIREQVQYPPTDGRYRVYIIDEVHMLSIGAVKDIRRTAVLCYFYSGYNRSTQNTDYYFVPLPEVRL